MYASIYALRGSLHVSNVYIRNVIHKPRRLLSRENAFPVVHARARVLSLPLVSSSRPVHKEELVSTSLLVTSSLVSSSSYTPLPPPSNLHTRENTNLPVFLFGFLDSPTSLQREEVRSRCLIIKLISEIAIVTFARANTKEILHEQT